jgi:hypothetical protein
MRARPDPARYPRNSAHHCRDQDRPVTILMRYATLRRFDIFCGKQHVRTLQSLSSEPGWFEPERGLLAA